jgi:hypothetical protein
MKSLNKDFPLSFCSISGCCLKTTPRAGDRCLTLVILATQVAEIRRIEVQSQLGQIVHKTLSRKNPSQKIGLVEWLKV